jgi:N-acetylmuramoyl-L-alanine amidase
VIPSCIVIHHSAGPRSQSAEAIRRYHTAQPPLGRGWKAIGYHFVIEEDGTLVHGRPVGMAGAHALPVNDRAIGICLIGDNTRRGQEWTRAQIQAAQALIHTLRLIWPALIVTGHRDVHPGHTECPGLNAADVLAEED